jgi:hypothetical protein
MTVSGAGKFSGDDGTRRTRGKRKLSARRQPSAMIVLLLIAIAASAASCSAILPLASAGTGRTGSS